MSIKVDLSADAVDRQIELLRQFPEIADAHYRPVLKRDVKILADMVEPNIPERTGRSRSTFGSKVMGKGTSIAGEIGWYKAKAPFYIKFSEGGTKAHEISPRGSKVTLARYLSGNSGTDTLRFPGMDQGGDFVFVHRSVQNPGMSARGFMQSAWSQAQPMVEADILAANEAVLRDLSL